MKHTSFTMKTALLATLILSGRAMAQSLPDEINHPQYLRTYQSLEQVLATKTSEFNNLSAQKATIEKNISDMQRDQQGLPARNNDLQRLIDSKKQELSRIQSEMIGLEGILNKILEDLRRIDAMVAQLQKDIFEESGRNQNIQVRRNQVAQDVARINARLQQEIAEENQSRQVLNNLSRGLDNDVQKRNEDILARQNLARDVERYKRELPANKTKVAANVQASSAKKGQLAEAQGKLSAIKSQIASETSSLSQADSEMAPSKAKLATLKAQLATQMPEVAKLQKENADLNAKIESNKVKISATGLSALIAKRDVLENELSAANSQIETLNVQIVAAKEAIKPDMGQLIEVKQKIRELERSGANPTELAQLKLQAEAIEKRIAPKRLEIARLEKQFENLIASNAPRNQELTNVKAQIVSGEASVANLLAENETAKEKIIENQKIIDERLATNSGLVKEINDLEASIKGLQANRDRIAGNITQLKAQESTLTTQITSLTSAIAQLDAETLQLSKVIAEMEKSIADFPLDNRRLENRIQKYDEQIQSAKLQIIREEKLLARIQQDVATFGRDSSIAQTELNRLNGDLAQSNQLIGALQNKVQQEIQNRDTLTRYNQDSIRKYDVLKNQRILAEKIIADSNQEISDNNQDMTTISQELPRLRNQLSVLSPKVSMAEASMVDAQKKASDANAQYQSRIGLYQRYLSDAQGLGTERASIGSTDGMKAGTVDARVKAIKFATENAASEAKWVAIRRGFIRGEVIGFESGFGIGMNSSPDISQGNIEGKIAGAKRAKDHANLVLKPEFYLSELGRRLVEDEVSSKNKLAFKFMDEVKTISSSSGIMQRSDNSELTQQEIDASSRILSSLDAMIEQALVEANQVVSLRSQLADARSVYSTPGNGENAANANCAGVYKNVKDFIDACKVSYGARYQDLYVAAHQESFIKAYGQTFAAQIIKTFDAELARLYPSILKEAIAVGTTVGVAAGKKEIYSQSFVRAENASYAANIQIEESRVEGEAIALVGTYLNEGSALTLTGEAKLKAEASYGVSPGAEVELKMLLKNIGSKAATTSVVRITSCSSNLVIANRDAGISAVAPKSQADLAVMKFKVNDDAVPGSKVVLSGELIHSGNLYSANRIETFRVEAVVAVNPSVESESVFDTSPKVSTLGFVKKHNIEYSVRPKFEGVVQGYEVSIEEVGSTYARFTNSKFLTERLDRGVSKKMFFEYKLDKSARGKTINFKVTVKNGDAVAKTSELQINAQ